MLAARRRPGKLPEGFYAAAEKEADAQIRKESRPRPRPLSNKTDWSHAKIKIGPRHQASLPRLDRRRPPPAEGRGGSFVEDPAALEREVAIRGKDWSPAVWKSKFYGSVASICTPSTRRLLDGVAVRVSHRSTELSRAASSPRSDFVKNYRAPDTLVDFHTGHRRRPRSSSAPCGSTATI